MTTLDPAANPPARAVLAEPGGLGCCDKAAAAAYIAELSSMLAALARDQNIGTLGYLLDLARLEAETISHKAAHS